MNIAIIIAGGCGNRFGGDIPKQFVEIDGKPIIEYTLEKFQMSEDIDEIIVVSIAGWVNYIQNLKSRCLFTKLTRVVEGGDNRFFSIVNGINSLSSDVQDDDIIIIHDAVRPCISKSVIKSSIHIAEKYGAALAVAPCFDTMFVSESGLYVNSVYPREKLFKGQTPESMRYSIAASLYDRSVVDKKIIDSPTALLMEYHECVALSEGSQSNLKITTQDDIIIFKTMLKNMEDCK